MANKILNKKILATLTSVLLLSFFLLPALSHADSYQNSAVNLGGLVPCDGSAAYPCDFKAFIGMINNIIKWIIGIAGVIFTITLIYGGFLYITSGEKPGNKEKAKTMLYNTLIGFVVVLTAWVIVFTILNYLVSPDQKGSVLKFIGNGN